MMEEGQFSDADECDNHDESHQPTVTLERPGFYGQSNCKDYTKVIFL